MSRRSPPGSEREPLLLAIEASNPSLGTSAVAVAAMPALRIIDREPIAPSTRDRDDLIPAIDRLLARAGLDRRTISQVAISAGPGGYTAIRMAIAAGAMIAEGVGMGRVQGGPTCVAVPTSAVAAASVADGRHYPLAVALAHKGETAFVTVFREALRQPPLPVGYVIGPEGFATLGVRTLVADPALPANLREAARAAGMTIEPLRLAVEGLVQASRLVQAVEPGAIRPIYAREPEAVTLWRARHGTG